jgi:dihydrofolate reductase
MAKLIYSAITSLDGYTADENGNFDWSAPDEEVHAFVNDLERDAGTYLYGRRMYEVMRFWETMPDPAEESPAAQDYARIWRAADKVVFSRTLESVSSARTRIEREFDAEGIRRLKANADRPISIGGPGLASEALRAGLVDEVHRFIVPAIIGGGTSFLPDGLRCDLALLDERRFGNGVVHVHYAIR